MTATRKKILFITPGAQSFGGNIFLLNFLRWYKRECDVDFITLYGHGGDLEKDFAELSPTYQYYFSDSSPSLAKKAAGKLANQLELRRSSLRRKIAREKIDLIYCNAVTNGRMLSMFDSWDVPVITHCHELESLIQLSGIHEFNRLKDRTTHFVAVSRAVRENLIRHDIADDKITIQHGFIPMPAFSDEEIETKRVAIRRELGMPDDAFLVGASGTLNWRKAPEIFVQLAKAVASRGPDVPVHFLWIGGASKESPEVFRLNYDTEKLGVSHRVHFIEHTPNPLAYFSAIDVFAMVSREDPFPLVCLEAASVGKPIICFADAGGMPEFVEDDCGFVIPYLDIDGFGNRIIELLSDTELRKRLGSNTLRKVRERHDIETSAPKLAELIERHF